MGFLNGRVTFTRYRISGQSPLPFGEEMLALAEQHVIGRHGATEATDGVSSGWAGGDHVLDLTFDLAKNVINDALHLAIRVDTDKIPSSLLRAYTQIETDALAKQNPSGLPTKAQRTEAKEAARLRAEAEAADGRFRRLNHYPVLWDGQAGILYAGTTSTSVLERLQALFRETFDRDLEPLTAGSLAMGGAGDEQDVQDRLGEGTISLFGGDSAELSTVAWAENAPNILDHLGNEFLVWLWHAASERERHHPAGRRLRGRRHAGQDPDARLPPRGNRPRQPHRRFPHPSPRSLAGAPVGQAAAQGGPDPGPPRRAVRADASGRDPRRLGAALPKPEDDGLSGTTSRVPGSIACVTSPRPSTCSSTPIAAAAWARAGRARSGESSGG